MGWRLAVWMVLSGKNLAGKSLSVDLNTVTDLISVCKALVGNLTLKSRLPTAVSDLCERL